MGDAVSRLLPKAVHEISTGDAGVDRVQEELARKTRDIEGACPLLRGVHSDATLASGVPSVVSHKLGRQPKGWIVVDASGDVQDVQRTAWDAKTLTLLHAGAASLRVKVWVY